MAIVYLSLGSNLGDQIANLERAHGELTKLGAITSVSSLYKTEPVGLMGQPWFLNQAIALETSLAPLALLKETQKIENTLGRVRTVRFGPRTIDIDILLYDDVVAETPELTLPHPRMLERRFVLQPLSEIVPQIIYPVLEKNIQTLLSELTDTSTVEKIT